MDRAQRQLWSVRGLMGELGCLPYRGRPRKPIGTPNSGGQEGLLIAQIRDLL